jgi:hypothetical protein
MQRKKVKGALAVTANELGNGLVVFLAADGRWSPRLADAAVHEATEQAEAALATAEADAKRNIVLNPYLFEMARLGAAWQPVEMRERIRAFGPTTEAPSLEAYAAP